jgi:four helix bundle protein
MDFCVKVYEQTKSFPKEEVYGLTSQIRRAATSVTLNIAEGSACKTSKEFIQFLYIALRSQYEVATILKLATRLNYLDDLIQKELESDIAEIGRLLQAFINSLQNASKKET